MKTAAARLNIIFIFAAIICIALSILLVKELELKEVESYSVGMEVTEKTIQKRPRFERIFSIDGSGESCRIAVTNDQYNSYNLGDILRVEVTIKESSILGIQYKFYKILGLEAVK